MLTYLAKSIFQDLGFAPNGNAQEPKIHLSLPSGCWILLAERRPSSIDVAALRDLGLNFDFYLEHGMKRSQLVSNWRVYCPEDISAEI
jgi:hypothetical protein